MITADYSKNELPQSIKKGAGTNDVIILYCYVGTHTQDRNNLSPTDMINSCEYKALVATIREDMSSISITLVFFKSPF